MIKAQSCFGLLVFLLSTAIHSAYAETYTVPEPSYEPNHQVKIVKDISRNMNPFGALTGYSSSKAINTRYGYPFGFNSKLIVSAVYESNKYAEGKPPRIGLKDVLYTYDIDDKEFTVEVNAGNLGGGENYLEQLFYHDVVDLRGSVFWEYYISKEFIKNKTYGLSIKSIKAIVDTLNLPNYNIKDGGIAYRGLVEVNKLPEDVRTFMYRKNPAVFDKVRLFDVEFSYEVTGAGGYDIRLKGLWALSEAGLPLFLYLDGREIPKVKDKQLPYTIEVVIAYEHSFPTDFGTSVILF